MTKTDTLPAGSLRKLSTRRDNPCDDLVADYVGMLVDDSSKALQIGQTRIGSECLRRQASLEMMAETASRRDLLSDCAKRAIPTDRLTAQPGEDALDLLILGDKLGFSVLAEGWSQASNRLKIGGVLLIASASHGSAARLADTLFIDPNWGFEDMIGGEVAVFRKLRQSPAAGGSVSLQPVPAAEPEKPTGGLMSGVMRTLFRTGKDRSAPLDRTR